MFKNKTQKVKANLHKYFQMELRIKFLVLFNLLKTTIIIKTIIKYKKPI